MKPFNDILKDLCIKHKVTFINNHNSFIMASGELPFDFFHADQVNLKFSGIRKWSKISMKNVAFSQKGKIQYILEMLVKVDSNDTTPLDTVMVASNRMHSLGNFYQI